MPRRPLEEIFQESQVAPAGKRSLNDIWEQSQTITEQPEQLDTTFQIPEKIIPQPSPLTTGERLQLSFADDQGRETFLRNRFQFVERLPNNKFAVGDTPEDILPIDPEGMFNDVLGDLADVVAIVPPIAGQITGGILGTPLGPAGIIAGGGIGAAMGEAISRGIGTIAGVDVRKANEQAVDIAISGLFGAAGEGVGQAFKFAGRGLSSIAKRSIDKAIRTSANPSKSLRILSKVFKVTAAVPEDDLIVAGTYGFNKTLSMPYNNPNYANTLATKMVKGVARRNTALGKMVGVGDDWAKANFGNKSVEMRQFGMKLLQDLSDPSVGMIDDIGRLNRGAFTETADFRTMKQLTDLFFAKNTKTGQLLPKNLKVSQLIDFKKRMSTSLKTYFKSGRANPRATRAIAQYTDDIINSISKETTATGLSGVNNPYIKANQAFRQWKVDLELLKRNGLNLEDITEIKGLIRTVDGEEVLVSKAIGDFARKLQDKSLEVRTAFDIMAKQIGVKFPSGGVGGTLGTLSDELYKYNAAQGFVNSNPNMLRLGAIAGLLGMSHFIAPEAPGGVPLKITIGLLLGTPAGAKFLLKGSEKARGRMGLQMLKKLMAGKPINMKLLRAILTQVTKEKIKQ